MCVCVCVCVREIKTKKEGVSERKRESVCLFMYVRTINIAILPSFILNCVGEKVFGFTRHLEINYVDYVGRKKVVIGFQQP